MCEEIVSVCARCGGLCEMGVGNLNGSINRRGVYAGCLSCVVLNCCLILK